MRTALTATALLAVVLAGPASAHVGDRVLPIWELPTSDLPDLHDGTLEDWEEVLPDASLDHTGMVFGFDQAPDPANLAIRVFLAWHNGSQRILVAVEWLDDMFARPSEPHPPDQAFVMLDGDHSGGRYWGFWGEQYSEAERELLNQSQAQFYNVFPTPRPDGYSLCLGTDSAWSTAPLAWVTAPPWSDVGTTQEGESPSYVTMEMYLTPWDQLHWEGPEQSDRTELEAGKIIGFQLVVEEYDDRPGGGAFYIIGLPWPIGGPYPERADLLGSLYQADFFADGELIPCYRGDCSGAATGVSQDSWGRIKASFR